MTGHYKIVDDIELPARRRAGVSSQFARLGIGQGFSAPFEDQKRLAGLAWYWGQKLGAHFTVRRDDTNGCVVVKRLR